MENDTCWINIALIVLAFCIGAFFGYSVLPSVESRETVVQINKGKNCTYYNFNSNFNNNGDTYLITVDGDTVSQGVFVNHEWK